MNNTQFINLTSLANIDLIGEGVTQFLDGQLSINTNSLRFEKAKLACFCNHKGRIVALFHIVLIENGVRLILPTSTLDFAISHIKKYSVFFKVETTSNTTQLSGVCCDNISVLEQSNLINIDQTNLVLAVSDPGSNSRSDTNEGDDSFWFTELALNKIAWLGEDTVEHFLPHSLNLPDLGAVDFKKGCFTGQEVIARMQYKGKLKQHLHRLTSNDDEVINNKQKLYQDEKSIGEVVCCVNQGKNNSAILALIKDSANLSKQFQTSPENSPILEISS